MIKSLRDQAVRSDNLGGSCFTEMDRGRVLNRIKGPLRFDCATRSFADG